MADGTDFTVLRRAVEIATADLSDMNTHATLNEVFRRLRLPDHQGSKHERVSGSIAALPDADLPALAQRILEQVAMKPAARNALQDALWAHQNPIQIPKRTRRDIARALDATNFVYDANRFMTLLDRCWVLDDELDGWLMGENPNGLRAQIMQHVIRNPEDWPAEMLFERLGAFDAGDARFARFLEGLASADTVPDEPTQRSIVEAVNPQLRSIGAALHETGTDGGYPVFSLISTRAARAGRPKNLIFASREKPDIRFRDAIDNEIEIVTNADRVLVYDRPIGADGIRWRDLLAWWMETQQIADETAAKDSLYKRLQNSLPENSPPQQYLFDLYHRIHGSAVPDLPALLPEVWLHWDPVAAARRGRDALLHFRMDFLMLLPHGQRVVLEVDGAHHFTAPDGKPSSTRYANNVRGDRDLKLNGYEVFRFGATELLDRDRARAVLEPFFADLFRLFDVTPGPH